MIVLQGKYNIARIFLPKDKTPDGESYLYMDDATRDQILTFLNHPAFKGEPICIMPDTHFGKGAVIGFTFKTDKYVIPNVVGVDIGCGIDSVNLGTRAVDVSDFDAYLRKTIPVGFSVHQYSRDFEDKLRQANDLLISEVQEESLHIGEKPEKVQRHLLSLGTLGGGNHFIELGLDDEGNTWATVHSGSRGFGLAVANSYQNVAREKNQLYLSQSPKDLEFLPLEETAGSDYMHGMSVAQDYAALSRTLMLQDIVRYFDGEDYANSFHWLQNCVFTTHNYIDTDGMVRKGAIRAREGERVIIPFNMRDGLIIAVGKGNKEWNESAPHGAGRVLSRKKAKEQLSLEDARKEMADAGVFTTSLDESTLDEASGAYKDKSLILEAISPTVDVERFVKPYYNLKAKG